VRNDEKRRRPHRISGAASFLDGCTYRPVRVSYGG
jgi:hypothetical protein